MDASWLPAAMIMTALELGLPPEAAELEGIVHQAESMGIDLANFGAERSRKQTIQAHNNILKYCLQHCTQRGSTFISTSSSWDTKPVDDFPRPPAYAALTPISCADLQPQTTHR